MREAWLVIKHSLGDVWDDVWTTIVCTMLWILSLVLVLPAPPVTFGLFYYGNRRAHGEVADLHDFWYGIRTYWKAAYRWGLLNLAVILLLAGDAWIIGREGNTSGFQLAQGLYITLVAFWLLLQLYAIPFLLEQRQPRVIEALRNAAVMIGRNPVFSLVLLCLLAGLLTLGTLLCLISVAVGGCLLACAGNYAVLDRLAAQER